MDKRFTRRALSAVSALIVVTCVLSVFMLPSKQSIKHVDVDQMQGDARLDSQATESQDGPGSSASNSRYPSPLTGSVAELKRELESKLPFGSQSEVESRRISPQWSGLPQPAADVDEASQQLPTRAQHPDNAPGDSIASDKVNKKPEPKSIVSKGSNANKGLKPISNPFYSTKGSEAESATSELPPRLSQQLDAEGAARKTAQPVVGKVETSQQSVVDEGPKQDMPNRQTPDPDVVGTNVVGTNVSQRNSGATNSSNPKTKRDESFAQTPAIGGGGGLIPLAQSNPLPAKTAVNERTENNEHPSVESSQQTFPPEISGTVESESAQHAAATSPFAGTAGMSGADSPRALPPISDDAGPLWWKSLVASSLLETNENTPVDLDQLILMALSNSPRIIAISQDPLIEEQEIVLSQSKFDPALFTKTQFDSRNDPVGNTLTTGPGGAPFLQDKIWSGTTGVRKKMQTGAAVDLSQKLGFHNSNSQFFSPQDQGTATLSLNFNQPLLRGGGRMYNQSRIILAQSFADTAWQRYYTELQGELLNVAEAYWRLYFFRCQLVQRQFSVQRAEVILAKLEIREGFDSLPNQIVRARAALQARRTSLANAVRDVRNAETTIRKLTAMSNWSETYMTEMIPAEAPQYDHVALPIESVVDTALELRPEIKQALQRAKSASIQSEISRHELLPELNLLLGSYVAGLEGRSDIPQAFSEQFSTTPGYYAGLEFNLPYRNRAAQSVHRQRMFKLKAIRAEVDLAVQEVVADAQTSVRKLNSAYATLVNSHESLLAARKDLEFQQRRWQTFALVEGDFAEGQNATILLEQLLDSQQRLTQEELAFSQAELDFKVAQIYLKKALGTLLQQASPFAGLADENQP